MPRIVPEDATLIPKGATRVFEGILFDVYQWPQQLFDGSTATFERLRRPDTVVFIAVKDDQIFFIQEQQPNSPQVIDLPGGRVDKGEEWEQAVARECSEELGLGFKNWRLVNVVQPVTKMEWFVATYLATECISEGATSHDAGEKITIRPMSFDEAKAHVTSHISYFGGYIGDLFGKLNSMDDLLALPEFKGRNIS